MGRKVVVKENETPLEAYFRLTIGMAINVAMEELGEEFSLHTFKEALCSIMPDVWEQIYKQSVAKERQLVSQVHEYWKSVDPEPHVFKQVMMDMRFLTKKYNDAQKSNERHIKRANDTIEANKKLIHERELLKNEIKLALKENARLKEELNGKSK